MTKELLHWRLLFKEGDDLGIVVRVNKDVACGLQGPGLLQLGGRATDDLHQRHMMGRIEKVHSHQPLRMAEALGQQVEVDGRGVRGQDRIAAADRVDLRQQLGDDVMKEHEIGSQISVEQHSNGLGRWLQGVQHVGVTVDDMRRSLELRIFVDVARKLSIFRQEKRFLKRKIPFLPIVHFSISFLIQWYRVPGKVF